MLGLSLHLGQESVNAGDGIEKDIGGQVIPNLKQTKVDFYGLSDFKHGLLDVKHGLLDLKHGLLDFKHDCLM